VSGRPCGGGGGVRPFAGSPWRRPAGFQAFCWLPALDLEPAAGLLVLHHPAYPGGLPGRDTVPDPSQHRPADLVNRDFAPPAPDRLQLVDFTFVST